MLRTLLLTLATLSTLTCGAGERILFTVGATPVTAEEYARYRSQAKDGALETYIDYRLKVEDALAMRLDTTATFRLHLAALRGEVMRTYQRKVRMQAPDAGSRPGGADISRQTVRLSTATIRLPQSATLRQERFAIERMDTLLALIKSNGGKFLPCEGVDVRIGEEREVSGLLKEFAAQIEKLPPGQVSEPFISPFGVHIIKVESQPVERRRERDPKHFDPALLDDPELKMRLGEARDGLLAAFWDAASAVGTPTDRELKAYFERNRDAYRWDLPHYKGAVITCPDKKTASQVRKTLKKLPVEEWGRASREHPSWQAEVEAGLFRIGDNAVIDHEAFKCGDEPKPQPGRYTFIMGKKLVKGPDDYRDVAPAVRRDCIEAQRESRMRELRGRYKVEYSGE